MTSAPVLSIYLDSPHGEILVLIPDVSPERIPDLTKRFRRGEYVRARILQCVAERNVFKGTMRDVDGGS
jgi:hypothetical protein